MASNSLLRVLSHAGGKKTPKPGIVDKGLEIKLSCWRKGRPLGIGLFLKGFLKQGPQSFEMGKSYEGSSDLGFRIQG